MKRYTATLVNDSNERTVYLSAESTAAAVMLLSVMDEYSNWQIRTVE
jgi:hypothetical protein